MAISRRSFLGLLMSALAVGVGWKRETAAPAFNTRLWNTTPKQIEFMNSPPRVFFTGRGGDTAAINAKIARLRREFARQAQEQIWANPPKGLS